MNRIVLIGNGFDLAHGLKTSYQDFINWYWEQRVRSLSTTYSSALTDPLCDWEIIRNQYFRQWNEFAFTHIKSNTNIKDVLSEIEESDFIHVSICPFFRQICYNIEAKGWVDIENEYYELLKFCIFEGKYSQEERVSNVKIIHEQLAYLQHKLIEYLSTLSANKNLLKSSIRDFIYSPIASEEVCVNRKDWLDQEKDYFFRSDISQMKEKLSRYNIGKESQYTIEAAAKAYQRGDMQEYESRIREHEKNLWALPDQILFLSFNYTDIINFYCQHHSDYFIVNHIHGTLDNSNSIIFGYGDELDDKYKPIKDKNDNTFLKNIKSIRYLESDNYRKMLQFIESAPFQIYIMGHSCGNSDRTLLNTLFEHKNCMSIKPYYHIDKDGKDNYMEIVQNIARNFTDMKLMRDRVVNKTYTEAFIDDRKK